MPVSSSGEGAGRTNSQSKGQVLTYYPESPQRVDDSPETPWISSEWTATLEKHSTTKPEVEFSTDSRFENWCSLLDKICGGRAYMLRSKRKNLYVQDELPNVEDVEEAIWVVLQKLGQVD